MTKEEWEDRFVDAFLMAARELAFASARDAWKEYGMEEPETVVGYFI